MDSESSEKQRAHEEPRRATDPDAWTRAFQENLFYVLGRFSATATLNDKYLALAYSVRDQLLDCWVKSSEPNGCL